MFSRWLHDYKKYGIIPGLSIDCIPNAHASAITLVTIHGRTNAGQPCVFAMGFLADETTEEFEWLLSKFKSFILVVPAMIAVDQHAACMKAARKVFPSTYITLDDYPVNKSQNTNISSYLRIVDRSAWCNEMNSELDIVRKSRNPHSFIERREQFERKYFRAFSEYLPNWYQDLYYGDARIMLDCYNKVACDTRLLFQVSGCTESSNSMYKEIVALMKLPIGKVPREMERVTSSLLRVRHLEETTNVHAMVMKLQWCHLGMSNAVLEKSAQTYTLLALKVFYSISIRLAQNYM